MLENLVVLQKQYQRFRDGKRLTDENLSMLIEHMKLTAKYLAAFNADHGASLRCLRQDLNTLCSYQDARKYSKRG